MEKNQTSCPKAVCQKIFRAITFSPAFSTIRRISSPAKSYGNPPLPNSDSPRRSLDIKTKLTSPQRSKPRGKEGSEVPIKFDYTTRLPTPPIEKPKPIITLNGSNQTNGQVPPAWMAQQAKALSTDMVQSGKPIVSSNGQQADNKSKPKADMSNRKIQVQIERHQANKEESKKPIQHYDDTFSAYINQTKKRIMSHYQDNGENSPKVVGHGQGHGGIGKDHHFSNYIDQTKRKIRTTSSLKDWSESFFK
ncbi:hypothetical protein REPUB_Repub12eG0123400 [Reevesia pubescens]